MGVLIPLIVVACAAAPVAEKKIPTITMPEEKSAPPKEKLKELPLFQIEEEKKIEQKYTFTLRDADIRDVLLALSQRTKLNIIIDPDVAGKVTVDLKEVTLTQALKALLTPIGLVFEVDNGFIRVSKPRMETRLFFLNYVSTARSGSRTTSTTTGGAGQGGIVGGAAGGVVGGTTSTVTSTDTADLFTEIEKGIKTLMSDGGKMTINKQAM